MEENQPESQQNLQKESSSVKSKDDQLMVVEKDEDENPPPLTPSKTPINTGSNSKKQPRYFSSLNFTVNKSLRS